MTALAENNIDLTVVAALISESTNDLSVLRTSNKNNWWGFASVQRGWGDKAPAAPHDLGDYRGYDHTFRCWSMEVSGQNTTDWGELLSFTFNLFSFPAWSVADTANHVFDILFKRTSDFQHGGYSSVALGVTLSNQYDYSFQINPSAPPDGGAALAENETFYIAVVHRSSPTLKWDDSMWLGGADGQESGDNYALIAAVVPDDPCNYYVYPYSHNAIIYGASSPRTVSGQLEVKIDSRANVTVYAETQFSFSSSFDVIEVTVNYNQLITKNDVPGTYQSRYLTFSTTSNKFSIGQTVYFRTRITSVIGSVTYSTNWLSNGSLVVVEQPPL